MSTFLYGRLTRDRERAPRSRRVQVVVPQDAFDVSLIDAVPSSVLARHDGLRAELEEVDATVSDDKKNVSHWVDIAAALVPAEVLAVHALLMAFASESVTNSSGDPGTVIAEPGVVGAFFWILTAMAAFLFLASAGFRAWSNWVRAALVALAFVCWTALQKDTAFDALKIEFDPAWLRPVGAVVVVVAIASFVKLLAGTADDAEA